MTLRDQTQTTERAVLTSQADASPAPVLQPIRRNGPRVRVLCSCGHWIDWRKAVFVGVQHDEEETLELKNCPACGSTRAVVAAAK